MSPSILVVGATGNTGGGVVTHLASVLPSSRSFSKHRLIALTRDKTGTAATELAKLPNVEFEEKDWVSIDADWLKARSVQRIFIAAVPLPTQFTLESYFFNEARLAGVEYVVRISTTASNVAPDSKVWYGRNHWAVETVLEQPSFSGMKWTSLQPNIFAVMVVPALQAWLKEYRETGKKTLLRTPVDETAPVAVIDGYEVGLIAGHLLAEEDPTPHSGKRYCLVGPVDSSGRDLVKILEKHAGTTVDEVIYRDTSIVQYVKAMGLPDLLAESMVHALASGFEGGTSVKGSPTSPEVLKLYAPKNSVLEQLDAALGEM